MPPLKIFIGYDSRQDRAWQVCRFSLQRHASQTIAITPLKLADLQRSKLYTRAPDDKASTEFSISRFLTPTLAGTHGWSLFVDNDFLFTGDIHTIFDRLSLNHAIYVVKHNYQPSLTAKMDGRRQYAYPRKNWSSLMLFNNDHPKIKALTPTIVNQATPAFLHRMAWLDDADIGELNVDWNFLVGEYKKPANIPHGIHFTNGGPWLDQWRHVDFANLWLEEEQRFLTEKIE